MRLKNLWGEHLKLPGMAVKMIKQNKDVVAEKYSYGDDDKQHFLYFEPKQPCKKQLILFIHGGGWKNGSPVEFKFIGNVFAQKGFHTVSLGYRHAPKNKYPTQGEDVFIGFNKILEVMKLKGIDTQSIIVVGSSAGGHLGGILVYDKSMQTKYGVDPQILKGLILLGSPIFFDVCKNKSITALLNTVFTENYDRKTAEPYSLIDGTEKTRVLCIHSKKDPICEYENSVCFSKKINSFNPGFADCLIVKNIGMYHSNLVAGIFLEDIDSCRILKILFKWTNKISRK